MAAGIHPGREFPFHILKQTNVIIITNRAFFSVPKELQLYAMLVSILESMFVASSEHQNAVTVANPMREEDLRKPCQRDKDAGVTAVEYTIMVVLIALGVAGFGTGIHGAVTAVFSRFVSVISVAT